MNFTQNHDIYGGAIYNTGIIIIENSNFNKNEALYGGVNYYVTAKATITHTTYHNNTARNGAVDYVENLSIVEIKNSQYTKNNAIELFKPKYT